MHFRSSVLLSLLAPFVYAHVVNLCGTSPPSSALKSASKSLINQVVGVEYGRRQVAIDTYVHVVGASDKVEEGYIGDDVVQREIGILNQVYNEHHFSFNLVETDRTINASWASPDGNPATPPSEPDMREALRKGGYSDLNIFFVPFLIPGGRCELPLPNPTSANITNDGCLVRPQNGPSSTPDYQQVLIHEVGHWLGLYHTFENGCNEPGDYVDDTPYEAYPFGTEGCPESGRNTCPDLPGIDPVDNYMTYVNVTCGPLRFTPGQAQRMHSLWHSLRLPYKK